MPLPKIEQKYYRTKLFSNEKEIQFRPFTIGQQKDVMIIRETAKEDIQIYAAIVDMLQDCVRDVQIKDLFVVDFEKLFYDVRAVADGNKIEFMYKCPDAKCKNENHFVVDTRTDFEVTSKNFNTQIKIEEHKIIINLRQHKMKDLFLLENKKYKTDDEKILDSMVYCIESVVNGEEVIKDFSYEDAVQFINSLPSTYLSKMVKFYENTPAIKCNKEFECDKCKTKINIKSSDVKSFLA